MDKSRGISLAYRESLKLRGKTDAGQDEPSGLGRVAFSRSGAVALIHLNVTDIDAVSTEFGIPVDEEGLARRKCDLEDPDGNRAAGGNASILRRRGGSQRATRRASWRIGRAPTDSWTQRANSHSRTRSTSSPSSSAILRIDLRGRSPGAPRGAQRLRGPYHGRPGLTERTRPGSPRKPPKRRSGPSSAEREGFEPSMDGTAHTGFRDRRIQPLCHLSRSSVAEKLDGP